MYFFYFFYFSGDHGCRCGTALRHPLRDVRGLPDAEKGRGVVRPRRTQAGIALRQLLLKTAKQVPPLMTLTHSTQFSYCRQISDLLGGQKVSHLFKGF